MDAALFEKAEKAFERLVNQIKPEQLVANKLPGQNQFEIANGFYEAGIRCLTVVKCDDGSVLSPTPPAVVNFAFSAELYLKAELSAQQSKKVKTHDLHKLFGALDQTSREKAISLYKSFTTRDEAQFQSDVKAFANAFEDFRYIYESEQPVGIALYRLVGFVRALYSMVRHNHPNWAITASFVERLDAGPSETTLFLQHYANGIAFRIVPTRR